MRRALTSTVLCLALLLGGAGLTGCGNRPAPGTPAAPTAQTVELRLNQGIAVLAKANTTAAKMAIQYNSQKAISDDTTRTVLDYTDQVAIACRSAAVILQSGRGLAEKSEAIRRLMASMQIPPQVATPALTSALAAVQMAAAELTGVR